MLGKDYEFSRKGAFYFVEILLFADEAKARLGRFENITHCRDDRTIGLCNFFYFVGVQVKHDGFNLTATVVETCVGEVGVDCRVGLFDEASPAHSVKAGWGSMPNGKEVYYYHCCYFPYDESSPVMLR